MDRSVRLGAETRPPLHGELVLIAAHAAFYLGHYERVAELLSQIDTGAVPLPADPDGLGAMPLLRGYLAASDGDLEAAERLLTESADLLQQGANDGARWLEAFAHNGLGSLTLLRGELGGGGQEFESSRRLAEQSATSARRCRRWCSWPGRALVEGRRDDARRLLLDAVPLVEQQPYYEGNAYCLEVAAAYGAGRRHAAEAAAGRSGMARALRDLIGATVWALLESASEAVHPSVREALGDEAYEAAFAEGLRADPRTAAAAVLALLEPA